MYKKVVEDDGVLESLNDKQTQCILLMNSLLTLTDNFRSKILTLNNLQVLEEMVTFTRQIYLLLARIVRDYCQEEVTESHKRPACFYPLIRQARQMEIFLLLCDMNTTLRRLKEKKYFNTCNRVYILNNFVKTLRPSVFFLEKFLLKHPHFHVVIPPPEKKKPKYYQKY